MTQYTGTLSAQGSLVGTGPLTGYSAVLTQTDKVFVVLNVDPTTHQAVGTIDQILTTNATISGGSSTFSDTQDSGVLSLSGDATQPLTLHFEQSGTVQSLPYTVDAVETLQLSADQSSILVTGTENINVEGSLSTLTFSGTLSMLTGPVTHVTPVDPATIQNDYLAIVRIALPLDQATAAASTISAGGQTETQYVENLLTQVAVTTIPAVAVEASMYGAVGTSAEVTSLTTQFLPPQVANAILNGLNAQVYACEALGLVFAFGNENGSTAFSTSYGPLNSSMPNTIAGDATFAAAAATKLFSFSETPNSAAAIGTFVANWKSFFTTNGIIGISHPTADQIDLAARGAAWGDAVGIALANGLGLLGVQVGNFLEDAAQGTAAYSASLASQPLPNNFLGGTSSAEVSLTGVSSAMNIFHDG